jgi:prepilin-type processing-associated H-X9-DG protein
MVARPVVAPSSLLPRRAAAFTLVELLVVIGVIALLISVLLPALNRAREAAQATKCAANMRAIGQAVHMYASGNKDFLPMSEGLFKPWGRWYTQLVGTKSLNAGFITPQPGNPTYNILDQSSSVFICPSDRAVQQLTLNRIDQNGNGTSYLPNAMVLASFSLGHTVPFKMSRHKNASTRLVFTEKPAVNSVQIVVGENAKYRVSAGPGIFQAYDLTYSVAARHGSKSNLQANVLFLDGHVERMKYRDILAPADRLIAGETNIDIIDPGKLWGVVPE